MKLLIKCIYYSYRECALTSYYCHCIGNDSISNFTTDTERARISSIQALDNKEIFKTVTKRQIIRDYLIEFTNYSPLPIYFVGLVGKWCTLNNGPLVIYPWSVQQFSLMFGFPFASTCTLKLEKHRENEKYPLEIYFNWTGGKREIGVSLPDSSRHEVIEIELNHGLFIRFGFNYKKDLPENFSIAVGSDPQPWRLIDGDPNDQENRWLSSTNGLFDELRKAEFTFVVINGDVTEFGKFSQYESFTEQISKIYYGPVLFGLGNHDYENNVGDCAQFSGKFSMNSCARFMINALQRLQLKYSRILIDFTYDKDSLAYAWTYGNFRFVQANNYPLYEVKLTSWIEKDVTVTPSVEWIKRDMENYPDKMYILNMHQLDIASLEKFKDYYSTRVAYIFVGHSHEPAIRCVNGMKIYDSGAMFKNQYFQVDIESRCVSIIFHPGNILIHKKCNVTISNDTCITNTYF